MNKQHSMSMSMSMSNTRSVINATTHGNDNNNNRYNNNSSSNTNFGEAFAPLAHHLFPDGCPSSANIRSNDDVYDNNDTSNSNTYEENHQYMHDNANVWPLRSNASPVSYEDASRSLRVDLKEYVCTRKGLSASEMHAVVVTACATLPSHWVPNSLFYKVSSDGGARFVVSKIKDGKSTSFRFMMRHLMIPNANNNKAAVMVIFSQTLELILSVASNSSTDVECKAIICRFLTLLTRKYRLHSKARRMLSDLYAIPFQMMLSTPSLCADAARLLHSITDRRHVLPFRAAKIRALYDDCKEAKGKELSKINGDNVMILYLLLQLYQRYDPESTRPYLPRMVHSFAFHESVIKILDVPDEAWFYDFKCSSDMKQRISEKAYEGSTLKSDYTLTKYTEKAPCVEDFIDGFIDRKDSTIQFLNVHNFTDLSASQLLDDNSVRHILSASCFEGQKFTLNSISIRTILPLLLYDQWYSQKHDNEYTEMENARMREMKDPRYCLLQSISRFAVAIKSLPPEVEDFILDEMMIDFDGNIKSAQKLFGDILPVVKFEGWSEFERRALKYFEKNFIHGSVNLKNVIIASLASLIENWVHCCTGSSMTMNSLEKLITWTDSLLVTGLVAEESSNGVDINIIRLAAIGFYESVCTISSRYQALVLTPSPGLMYRLLLSSTTVSIERLCGLLLRYKNAFENLKVLSVNGSDVVTPDHISRMEIFNCFVWDICSILWRKSPLPSINGNNHDESRRNSILFTDINSEFLLHLHSLPECFSGTKILSITNWSIFSPFAVSFLKLNHFQDGVIDTGVIKGKIKAKYLDYLRDHGFTNLYAFLSTFVSSLAIREQKRAGKRNEKHKKRKHDNLS